MNICNLVTMDTMQGDWLYQNEFGAAPCKVKGNTFHIEGNEWFFSIKDETFGIIFVKVLATGNISVHNQKNDFSVIRQ